MRILLGLIFSTVLPAAEWHALLNGKNLDGWEVIGDGQWNMLSDGTLLGQRTADLRQLLTPGARFATAAEYSAWLNAQSWLYTKRNDFDEFDLRLDYWTKDHGNSGVSIRDTSRAAAGITIPPNYARTPSKVGYEIQINNRYPDPHPSGSIYSFQDAPKDAQHDNDWNTLEIASRRSLITIRLNGKKVAEHAGDPKRPLTGPIGLQLHDQFSIVMFHNIQIREIGR